MLRRLSFYSRGFNIMIVMVLMWIACRPDPVEGRQHYVDDDGIMLELTRA